VKAAPQAQRRLLDLQAIDLSITQLTHRRRTLPELAEIKQLTAACGTIDDERIAAQVNVQDLDRDIARIEKDVEQVLDRRRRNQARLDAGSGPPRELEALLHEVEMLDRRQSELEDAELEVMETREAAQEKLAAAHAKLEESTTKRREAEERRDIALANIEKEIEFRRSGRIPLVADLPADLIALYERLREQTGGFGAAALRGNRCEGCRLELSGSELNALRTADPDEVIRHEECRRILVRNPD
jgi:predicted  nucleic acid-binding Zn-ribbon protein